MTSDIIRICFDQLKSMVSVGWLSDRVQQLSLSFLGEGLTAYKNALDQTFIPSCPNPYCSLSESPRLSTASTISGNDQTPALSTLDYPAPLGSTFHEGQRPASLVSTISSGSGSGSSQDGRSSDCSSATFEATAPIALDDERDVDLELSPAEGDREQRSQLRLACELGQLEPQLKTQQNNNAGSPGRVDRTHQRPLSPFAAMAPNPKLSYLDRVVMEILETERMYVRDLRSIVEVRNKIPFIKHLTFAS